MNEILISFEIKNEGIPNIFAKYIITTNEWNKINIIFKNNFDFVLYDDNLSHEKIFINTDTLKINENNSLKHIDAFKILFENSFFNYDLLDYFKNELGKVSKKNNEIFDMDEGKDDIDYYLKSKKNTPEFFNLDDEKVKKLILETRKTVNLFKNKKNINDP